VPYERKGVLFSEMLFFYLCASSARPRRILESGRARGQSTLLLALCFPQLPIISLEHDAASADVPVAAQRLRAHRNVSLEFGDAMQILPAIADHGDVVLIDGPKGFRALRLALRLLSQGRVSMVFVHDMTAGTAERRFLEHRLPSTLYSDAQDFAAVARALDERVEDAPARGFGLACLPSLPRGGYAWKWLAAAFTGFATRVAR
jgi:predicted O-methyltransferase YrrM